MKLKYQAQKGGRIKYNFLGMSTVPTMEFWWNETEKEWQRQVETRIYFSSHRRCKSVRAFRRMLKKAPAGERFVLVSRWRGHDVIGVGGGPNPTDCFTLKVVETGYNNV